MKIIHVPYTYFPDPPGGTEYYVHALAKGLADHGVDNLVAAPGNTDERYVHDGVLVVRLRVSPELPLRAQYADGDESVTNQFASLLDEHRPDVVHFHAFTSAASLSMAIEAKQRSISVVTTYHTPSVSCPRGALVRWGRQLCDGQMITRRCSQCYLHSLGMNRLASIAVGILPPETGRWLGDHSLEGGIWTALRASELIHLRRRAVLRLWQVADRIVALNQWTWRLLHRNGVAPDKIVLCRHGLAQPMPPTNARRGMPDEDTPLRLVFLGRMHPAKGPHLVVEALQRVPSAKLTLDLYGIVQGAADQAYQDNLRRTSGTDQRIRFFPSVPGSEVTRLLQEYDALVAPSQWMETGPLVVLEAFSVGVPVIGSDMGGIQEWVIDGTNGWLIRPYNQVSAWQVGLQELADNPVRVRRLHASADTTRTMADVATEMADLYAQILTSAP